MSDDNVQHYRIEAVRDGKVVKTQYLLSCTFYRDPPKTFTAELAGLPKNASVTVRVTAVNEVTGETLPLLGSASTEEAGGKYVGVFDGKTLCFYLNGVLADSMKVGGRIDWPTANEAKRYVIGGDSFNGGSGYEACFTGQIAAANIYSSVLNEEQIASLYAGYAG